MSEVKIIGPNVPNMPWQDRPADIKDKSEIPVWRYSENPSSDVIHQKVLHVFLTVQLCHMKENSSVYSVENRQTVFHISILEEAGMPSTGILTKKKFLSRMKTEMILCRNMHMIQDW